MREQWDRVRRSVPARPAACGWRWTTAAVAVVACVAVAVLDSSSAAPAVRGTALVVGLFGAAVLTVELVWLAGLLPLAMVASAASIGPALVDRVGTWHGLPVVVMLLLAALEAAGWSAELQSSARPTRDVIALRLLGAVAVVGGGGALSALLLVVAAWPAPSGLFAELLATGAIVLLAAVAGAQTRQHKAE